MACRRRLGHLSWRAAAEALAGVVRDVELAPDYVIPSVFNREVAPAVAAAVARAAQQSGVARKAPSPANPRAHRT
jgi:malate dehydrogenase (oxaloacetate-decarboxylating)